MNNFSLEIPFALLNISHSSTTCNCTLLQQNGWLSLLTSLLYELYGISTADERSIISTKPQITNQPCELGDSAAGWIRWIRCKFPIAEWEQIHHVAQQQAMGLYASALKKKKKDPSAFVKHSRALNAGNKAFTKWAYFFVKDYSAGNCTAGNHFSRQPLLMTTCRV